MLRIKQIEITLQMISDFDKGVETIRSWMQKVQSNLEVAKHAPIVSSILALGHNLVHESDIRPDNAEALSDRLHAFEQDWISFRERMFE